MGSPDVHITRNITASLWIDGLISEREKEIERESESERVEWVEEGETGYIIILYKTCYYLFYDYA